MKVFGLIAVLGALLGTATFPAVSLAQESTHDAAAPLTGGMDVGNPPFALTEPSGELVGFSIDLAKALATKLGRPGFEPIDTNFGAIFAGLFAGRYEMITGTTNITAERAEQMLFSEPYLPTGLIFMVKSGTAFSAVEELKGKELAVNNGGVADKWATENAEALGFTVQRYNKNDDSVQAVLTGRAFAQLGDTPISRYIASKAPTLALVDLLESTRAFGFAFRLEDEAFRDTVEVALECLKQEGYLAELHVKWFGTEPPAGDPSITVYPGYGAPGFAHFRESTDTQVCS